MEEGTAHNTAWSSQKAFAMKPFIALISRQRLLLCSSRPEEKLEMNAKQVGIAPLVPNTLGPASQVSINQEQ